MPIHFRSRFLAFVFGLVLAGWSEAATPPTIKPSQVSAKNIGSCEIYDPHDPYIRGNALHPLGAIHAYVENHQRSHLPELKPTDYAVKYLKQPRHGTIKAISDENGTLDFYVPHAGYAGNDGYVAEVIAAGVKFKVVGYIRSSSDATSGYNDLCRRLGLPGIAWGIQ